MIVKWAVTVARTRSVLYSLARFLGDYQAIKRGRIGKRIANELLDVPHRPLHLFGAIADDESPTRPR